MYLNYRFDIEGMHCPSCSYRLKKHLLKLKGIKNAIVNLASESLQIEYDDSIISLKDIEKKVQEMGYQLIQTGELGENRILIEQRQKRYKLKLRLSGKKLIFVTVFFVPLLIIALSPLLHYELPLPLNYSNATISFVTLEFLLSIPIIVAGWSIIKIGWTQLFKFQPNLYSLVALSITAALLYSFNSTYFLVWEKASILIHPLYYLPACATIVMTMLGKYIENRITRQSDQHWQELKQVIPDKAVLLHDNKEEETYINQIQENDIIKVGPQMRIPVDGIVDKGHSMIEESLFSGSQTPILCVPGDKVLAGMINQEGYLYIKVQKKGEQTFLAEVLRLIENGENSRPALNTFADNTSSWVIQAILAIAFISAGIWLYLGKGYLFSLTVFISVLVIACPVAIALAVPVSVLFATRRGSALSILIRRIASFESICKATAYVFNLTGTITKGNPIVTDIIPLDKTTSDQLLMFAASAESLSDHPIGSAIRTLAREKDISLHDPDPFKVIPGEGIEAVIEDTRVDIGNHRLMTLIQTDEMILEKASTICRDLSAQGKSAVMIALDGSIQGIIATRDVPRSESRQVIESLKRHGKKIYLLTGEHWSTAKYLAQEVDILEVKAEVQPQNRARFIRKLQHEGNKVVMIGDGLYDANSLAQADAGIAIGTIDNITTDAADIVLLNKDLRLILTVNRLAKKTIRNMRENLFFAFLYNLLMVPIAAGILYFIGIHFLLNPMIAVLAMFLGSLSIFINALRLNRFK